MKTFKSVLGFAFVFAALGAIQAFAQNVTRYDVPFAFSVSGKTLPAGEYRISPDQNSTGLVLISSTDGRTTFAMTHNGVASASTAQPTLVFHRYGNQYFLARISAGEGTAAVMDLPTSKAEREAVTIASNRTVETVTLVAMR